MKKRQVEVIVKCSGWKKYQFESELPLEDVDKEDRLHEANEVGGGYTEFIVVERHEVNEKT